MFNNIIHGNSKYHNILTEPFLYREYIINRKSCQQIAKEIGCNYVSIYNYLKKYDISIRTLSELAKGKNNPNFKDGGEIGKIHYCKEIECDNVISYSNWSRGNRRCKSCANIKKWKDPKFREKTIKAIFKANNWSPNKPEKLLTKLLNKTLPKEYKFVGNGKIFIAGFVPDFINCNGQKKIIEMFGDYWHNKKGAKEKDKRRIIAYKKLDYKVLIIWQFELNDLNKVKEKVLEFNNEQKYKKSGNTCTFAS